MKKLKEMVVILFFILLVVGFFLLVMVDDQVFERVLVVEVKFVGEYVYWCIFFDLDGMELLLLSGMEWLWCL